MQQTPNDLEHPLSQDQQTNTPTSSNNIFEDPLFDINDSISLDLPDLNVGYLHDQVRQRSQSFHEDRSPLQLELKQEPFTGENTAEEGNRSSLKRSRWSAAADRDGEGKESPTKHSSNPAGSASGTGSGQIEIKKMTDIKSRACDECRRRKTACYYLNSENAKCFRCQMENIECTFSVRTRSTSQGNIPGVRQGPIPQKFSVKQQTASLSGPIEDYSQLPGRSLLKKTLSLQHPRSSFAIGQHGLWDKRVLERISLDKSNQARVSPNLSLRKVAQDSWFMIRNEGGQTERAHDCDEIERLVYPYGRSLVNAFFMFFQPEYPVLHEKIFVEKYMRTHRELMPALLGAVYLLGMRWWNHNSELSTVPRPDSVVPKLYDLTLMNFFKSSGGSSLSLIQAGLLLLQCSYSDSRHLSICSVINGASLRLALNRNCSHWKLPRWEINLRMRLSWAIYSQATWISLFESIPPLIQDSSFYLSSLNPDMFDNGSTELNLNGALFIQLSKLSLIVHDMHNLLSTRLFMMYSSEQSAQQAVSNNANINVFSPSTAAGLHITGTPIPSPASPASSPAGGRKMPAESILELIKPIQLRLHDWFSKLPSSLVNVEGDPPTGSFSLRISYISAEVTLHRFIIRAVSGPQAADVDPAISNLLRSSARERLDVAYDLLKMLRPYHLQQFWYFPAAYQLAIIGVFAALMFTTSETKEESEYYQNFLRRYISIIQVYSDNEVMSTALRTLRSSIAGVPGLEL